MTFSARAYEDNCIGYVGVCHHALNYDLQRTPFRHPYKPTSIAFANNSNGVLMTWDNWGNLVSATSKLGLTTNYTYSDQGNANANSNFYDKILFSVHATLKGATTLSASKIAPLPAM